MKPERFAPLFFFIALLLCQILFWKEQFGLNTLLFSILMIGMLYTLYREQGFSRGAVIMAIGTLFSALLVTVHNSAISCIVHLLSFVGLIGFVQQRELRFVWYAFLFGLLNILEAPHKMLRQFLQSRKLDPSFSRGFQYIKIGFIPVLVLFVFYILYYLANPRFASFADHFFRNFSWLFNWNIPFARIVFTIISLFVCAATLLQSQLSTFVERQKRKTETLERQRGAKWKNRVPFSPLSLRNEYRAGLFLIYALNVLLLIVNLTDITFVWFGFDETSPQNLKTYVHEGTWLLITAIILAMGVLLFFFRKNLNFFPKNKYLLIGAYIWIIQNALLAISVGIRNYRYIDFHGLAYKRIGVFLFLLLVFYGLWTMYQKVSLKKSLYFLISKNAWAVYAILLFCSTVNWDILITKYNLQVPTKGAVDVHFMLNTISDKNLYLLKEHRDKLVTLDDYPSIDTESIDRNIALKERRYKMRNRQQGWPSWNLSDYRNAKYLQQSGAN